MFKLKGTQTVHISAKLKTGLSAHRQTDKSENIISASFTPFIKKSFGDLEHE